MKDPFVVSLHRFREAFDTVEHCEVRVWKALHDQGVAATYIEILIGLYSDQTAYVRTDHVSRKFAISKGYQLGKQGDPISPALFTALLESKMKDLTSSWQRRGFGIGVYASGRKLCNQRFADDIVLIATTRWTITLMLQELEDAMKDVGLKVLW